MKNIARFLSSGSKAAWFMFKARLLTVSVFLFSTSLSWIKVKLKKKISRMKKRFKS